METQKTPECIQDLLKINNVTRITKFDEINQIYDYKKLKEKDEVNIIQEEQNSIIIFDTDVFNSCYVIDVFNNFLETQKFVENTKIYYCDNLGIYEELFRNFFEEKFSVEKPIPVILTVLANNRNDSDLFIHTETFGPIVLKDFVNIKQIIDGTK